MDSRRTRRGSRAAVATALVLAMTGAVATDTVDAGRSKGPKSRFGIEVLSSRPEYVSGGDARIRIDVPRTVPMHKVKVTADGVDVTRKLTEHERSRTLEGVVDDLPLGSSTIRVTANGRGRHSPSAALQVVNHPAQGPMFSGPHQTPFICETVAAGLGLATDPVLCTAKTRIELLYRTTAGTFATLPTRGRPADLVTTTTTTGKVVDYIVRLETGVINRAVYQTAVLYDPRVRTTDSPWATRGWNRRLIYSYGGGCNAGYHQGTGNGGVLSHEHLSQGYATASSSLNVLDNNCNDVSSAETTSMVKEHFIETYGVDDFTIGWGGSGGAISQHMIGQNYPGLLDGVIPTVGFPDPFSIGSGIADCRLLVNYSQTGGALSAAQLGAVSGHQSFNDCIAWTVSFSNRFVADEGCPPALPVELRWDPDTNPNGARCTISDHLVNILGVDPATGVAYTPYDNQGVQYGLDALAAGVITPEQFVAVNEEIGGYDVNGHFQPARTVANPVGVERVYSTGRIVSGAGGLANMPIIDVRPYLDQVTDIHVRFHSFSMRDRLIESNGRADNQVIQVAPATNWLPRALTALTAMDEWLTELDADWEERTPDDVAAAKPEWLVDGCWDAAGTFIAEPASYDSTGTCNTLYPPHGDPRTAAGEPIAGDVLKCRLEPLDRSGYPVTFTDVQWSRLEALFSHGVCDHSVAGVAQVPLAGVWQDFGP